MATTADTLITEVRRRRDDATDEAYGDSVMLDFLNDGCEIFASTTGCCQHLATVTPDGSNPYIALSTANLTYRHVIIYAVEYGTTVLDFAPLSEYKYKTASSVAAPTCWTVWTVGGVERMYFDTIPATTSDVSIYFTYIPDTLTAVSSNVDIPERWHPAIKAYMQYRVDDLNREASLADRSYAEFEQLRQQAANINESLLSWGGYTRPEGK